MTPRPPKARPKPLPSAEVTVHFYCDGCDGVGDVHGETCPVCRGSGHQPLAEIRPTARGGK